jgi:hypothetical protein
MRGDNGQQAGIYSYISPEQRVPGQQHLSGVLDIYKTVKKLSLKVILIFGKNGPISE